MKNIKYILLSAVVIGFTACAEPEDVLEDNNIDTTVVVLPELTAGTADFSTFVALGASFTAGYTDGALFIAGQENSFPNILAQQFANVGGGAFTQPLMNDNIGGLLFGGAPSLDAQGNNRFAPRFYFDLDAGSPVRLTDASTTDIFVNNPTGPFNNMGVPGAKSFHLLFDGYGNPANLATATANPYFVRMASSPTATVLGDAMAQSPSFFTISEIAGNDVLGYALAGGDVTIDQITPQAMFDGAFGALITTLTSNNAQGVVANIPYITSLPHFTTVPHNPIPLDAATAGFLNSVNAYGAYNAGIQGAFAYLVSVSALSQEDANAEIAKRTITFAPGDGNAVVIFDESLTDLTGINVNLVSMRQATADDLIVLSASSFIGTEAVPGNPATVNGVGIPLADKWVLLPSEQLEIKMAIDAFNATIESAADSAGLAFVDTNALLQQLAGSGYASGDFVLTSNLVTGGAFSLDGVHSTSRGYALLANEFMKAIDATYGSNFEASGNLVDIGDYPTNYSPTLQ
ncbi:MAG: G-D-S-L family lipolytic protein [Bacteroidetes bacterium]|nr:MAG: G-D-S-L family lipolytic protein [Bacteroidota bacterium]